MEDIKPHIGPLGRALAESSAQAVRARIRQDEDAWFSLARYANFSRPGDSPRAHNEPKGERT